MSTVTDSTGTRSVSRGRQPFVSFPLFFAWTLVDHFFCSPPDEVVLETFVSLQHLQMRNPSLVQTTSLRLVAENSKFQLIIIR